MKLIKRLNGFGIYQNNTKEIKQYGFNISILTPDNMEYSYMCSPQDSDMEFDKIDDAIIFIKNYNK